MEAKLNYKTICVHLCSSVFICGYLYIFALGLLAQDTAKTIRPHYTDKVDIFGRNYQLKWNGEIHFSLDDSYSEAIPDIDQLDVHIAEAKVLVEKRKVFPAIRLLKGIAYCERIHSKSKKTVNPDIQKKLNRLLSENQDRKDELEILTEPYGCYAHNSKQVKKLFIESKDFGYTYEIDSRFRYVFPSDLYRFARKEKEYNWKVSYFRILLPLDNQEKTFESEYLRYEKQVFYEPPFRIMFSIGQTYHKHTLSDTSHYPEVWDGRRGLSNSVKRTSNFIRTEVEKGVYETSFNLNHETQTRSYFGYETYKFSHNKGIGVFLTCPLGEKDECRLIWKDVR